MFKQILLLLVFPLLFGCHSYSTKSDIYAYPSSTVLLDRGLEDYKRKRGISGDIPMHKAENDHKMFSSGESYPDRLEYKSQVKNEKSSELYIPPGFELQIFESTGGSIAKPIDWYYQDGGTEWIISKEDSRTGAYETGVRIKVIPYVTREFGITAKQLVEKIFAGKKQETVINECQPDIQKHFSRVCIETIETINYKGKDKQFHILYSLFWSNKMDIAIFQISGTPVELWDKYEEIFNVMRVFRVLDFKRLSSS